MTFASLARQFGASGLFCAYSTLVLSQLPNTPHARLYFRPQRHHGARHGAPHPRLAAAVNEDLGGHFTWEQVKAQMYGKNREVLTRLFGPDRFSGEEMDRLGDAEKERRYQEEFRPRLALLPGLPELLARARQRGIAMAIGSAALPFNIDFVLDNLHIRPYFRAIVSADDVAVSKPHPEVFLRCAELLGVPPAECLVFEDVPKGAEAARNAGMAAVVLTTTHAARRVRAPAQRAALRARFHGCVYAGAGGVGAAVLARVTLR